MKKIVALLLAAIMVMSLAACGGSSDTTTAAPADASQGTEKTTEQTTAEIPDTENASRTDLNVAMTSDPGTFNPYKSSAAGYTRLRNLVYQGLGFRELDKTIAPIIAESWTTSEDGLNTVVKIRENVYDSKGNHVTADDVVFSCQQHIAGNGFMTWKYNDPENPVEKTGDYEVTLHFTQPTVSALDSILTQVTIITEKGCDGDPENLVNQPVGTGPYVLTDWVVGNAFTFEKNENYWMAENPNPWYAQNMDKITYKIISEAAQRAIELETGGVDFIFDPQATDLARIEANEALGTLRVNKGSTLNMYCNCSETSHLKDVRMRQAVAYAVDTVGLAIAATEGLGEAAYSMAHPITMEWRDEYKARGPLYAQDLDKAKALVAECTADGIEPKFEIMTDEDGMKRASAAIIQEACKQVGIEVEIAQLESAVFQSRYADLTAWDAYMGNSMANIYTSSFMTTQIDRTGYPDPSELRDAINEAFKVYDEATADKCIALWEQELPIIPLVTRETAYAYRLGLDFQISFDNTFCPGACTWK